MWYLSKGVVGGVLVCLGAIGSALAKGEVNMEDITLFGTGLGILGIRFKMN